MPPSDFASALTLVCSKVSWPRFIATAVLLSFDHVPTWTRLGQLLCLACGAVLIYALAAWAGRLLKESEDSRAPTRRRKPHSPPKAEQRHPSRTAAKHAQTMRPERSERPFNVRITTRRPSRSKRSGNPDKHQLPSRPVTFETLSAKAL